MTDKLEKKSKLQQKRKIKTCSEADKEGMKKKSKAENTHKATNYAIINCLQEYLMSNGLGKIDEIEDDTLPKTLENFFMEIRKVKKFDSDSEGYLSGDEKNQDEDNVQFKYKKIFTEGYVNCIESVLQINKRD